MAFESKGVAVFQVDSAPRRFTFAVTTTNETLHIWIEDAVSKERWETKALAVHDIVTIDTAIPQAKVADYAEHVAACLQREPAANDAGLASPSRTLSRAAATDGSRVLFVSFSLQVMGKAIALEYTFSLVRVVQEKVDLLASRLADLEEVLASVLSDRQRQVEQIKRLEAANAGLEAKLNALELQGTFTNKRGAVFANARVIKGHVRQAVLWERFGFSDHKAISFEGSGEITITRPGAYVVHAIVPYCTGSCTYAKCELRVNGAPVVVATNMRRLCHVLHVQTKDVLSIVHTDGNQVGCIQEGDPVGYIVIYALS